MLRCTNEPPTIRDAEFEQDVLDLVSETLRCNISGVQRQTNARTAKFSYDQNFRQNFWEYKKTE